MKLNPPASSSDLEAAREIARRIHMRRRREDLGAPEPPRVRRPAPPAPAPPVPAPPVPAPPVPAPPVPAPLAPAPPARPARAAVAEPPPPPAPLFDDGIHEPVPPPSWDEPGGSTTSPDALDTLAGFGEPPAPVDVEPPGGLDIPDVDVPAVSPEEMIGLSDPEPEPAAPPSPFEIDLDAEGAPAGDDLGGAALPSWDDIADRCLALARAGAAMLVDPAGHVFAARGQWPAPGPDPIAARLVSTMDRTLKDAPTRSISAPVGTKHLTAWRVPLSEGLVTVALLGDAPVAREARPAIDTEIHRGRGNRA